MCHYSWVAVESGVISKGPEVKDLFPRMLLLEDGGLFKGLGLIGSP